MDEARLLALLNRFNTWWSGEEVPQSLLKAEHRRRDFFKVRERLGTGRQILTIRGPRQVGKTTLCGQLIDSMLNEKPEVPPEHVLYLTADNSQVLSDPEDVIRNSIDVFQRHVLQKSIRDVDGQIFVFVDEVQKIDGWASTLKYYVDTYSNIQFVATGSVSTLIKQDAGETLIGRLDEQIILPMKFIDHVRYHELLDEEEIYDASTSLRNALKRAVREDDRVLFTGKAAKFFGTHESEIPKLIARKDEYLLKGGYPGVLTDDYVDAYAKLDSDLKNTVTGDLANVFKVKKPEKVLRVLSLLMESTTSKISIQNVADSAGVDRDTVERYLDHLEEFFLINYCEKYTTSEYRRSGHPKVYLQDGGLYNTLAGTLAEETLRDGEKMGPILETAVCDHARRLQFNLSGTQNADVTYFGGSSEVDFVLSGSEYVLPIEVKVGNSSHASLRGIKRFVDESDASLALVVNDGGAFEQDSEILHIPTWMFFFLC